MPSDELRRLIKKELEDSSRRKRAWTPWRRLLTGEIEKQIGCITKGCKYIGLYVTYQVESKGTIRLCACADHANYITLRTRTLKKYRHQIPLQTGVVLKPRKELFNKAEIRKIRQYDYQLNRRFEYEQRAKAGDIEAYRILQKLWKVKLPVLEDILRKIGQWPSADSA